MSTLRYLEGVGLLIVTVGPVAFGARELRRRLLPGWAGAPAWVADTVLAVAILIAVAEVLGTAGLLQLAPLVIACVAAGAATAVLARHGGGGERRGPLLAPAVPTGRLGIVAAWGSGALVLAQWSARVATEFDRGMTTPDTIWQHLPAAARFVQDGSIRDLQFFDREPFTVFYPFHSSLLHAEGMLIFGSDVLSPVINLGWLGFALLAAWCVGRPRGVGPACVVAVALVLGSPILVTTQAGGAYTDVVVIALVLASLALLANGGVRGSPLVLAGVAAGLALGTKFTPIPTVAALSVGVIALAPRGRRLRTVGVWVAALVLAGGFWYGRNLIHTGSPMPAYKIDLGFYAFPDVEHLLVPRETVASYLDGADTRRAFVEPALEDNFGPAWWAIIALSLAGMVAGLLSRDGFARMLAFTGIVSVAAYLFSPLVLGTEGFPYLLKYNVRYVTLAVALGLVALACRPGLGRGAPGAAILGGLVALLAFTQADDTLWPTAHWQTAVVVGPAALALAALLGWLGKRRRRPALAVGAVLFLLLAAGGALVHRDYLRDRYTRAAALRFKLSPVGGFWEWARNVHGARIAMAGDYLTYPLYGRDLSNRVDYVGHRGPHGAFLPIDTCPEWRRNLNAGHFQYVVTTRLPEDLEGAPPADRWTRSDPAATPIATNAVADAGHAALFRIDGSFDPGACPKPRLALVGGGDGRLIRLSSGAEIPIRPDAVTGFVESVTAPSGSVQVSGWAADGKLRSPARRILVLDGGRVLAAGVPTLDRPDVAGSIGPGAGRSGFRIVFEDPRTTKLTEPGRLRVFALTDQAASELPRLDQEPGG